MSEQLTDEDLRDLRDDVSEPGGVGMTNRVVRSLVDELIERRSRDLAPDELEALRSVVSRAICSVFWDRNMTRADGQLPHAADHASSTIELALLVAVSDKLLRGGTP